MKQAISTSVSSENSTRVVTNTSRFWLPTSSARHCCKVGTFTHAKSYAMAIESLAMISTAPDTTHYNQWAYQACTNRRHRTNETEAKSRTRADQVAERCQEGRLNGRALIQIFKTCFHPSWRPHSRMPCRDSSSRSFKKGSECQTVKASCKAKYH